MDNTIGWAHLDPKGFLRIAPTKREALANSVNGKAVPTDHPSMQWKPSDSTNPIETGIVIDYDNVRMYDVQSAEQAYSISKKLGELFEQVQ